MVNLQRKLFLYCRVWDKSRRNNNNNMIIVISLVMTKNWSRLVDECVGRNRLIWPPHIAQ